MQIKHLVNKHNRKFQVSATVSIFFFRTPLFLHLMIWLVLLVQIGPLKQGTWNIKMGVL